MKAGLNPATKRFIQGHRMNIIKNKAETSIFMVIYNRKYLILIIVILIFTSCRERYSAPTIDTLEAIVNLDKSNYKDTVITDETRQEIKNILEQYEQDISANISKKEELGNLYKQLGLLYLEINSVKSEIFNVITDSEYEISTNTERENTVVTETLAYRFMDSKMYREALDYFNKAIEIFPENELLFYYSGLCSGKIAKSIIDNSGLRYDWLLKAEEYYKTAIEIYPFYSDALYAISVLYVYEFNLPEAAEEYVLNLKNLEQENTDARFLLANIYYMTGRYDEALLEYNDILKIADSDEVRKNAIRNQEQIVELMESENE
jgi:tetratricopeptide (TPR) repeat protein